MKLVPLKALMAAPNRGVPSREGSRFGRASNLCGVAL